MIQGTQVVLRKDPPYSWSYNSRRTIRDSFHWRISCTNSYDRQTSFRPLPRFNNFFTHAAPSLSSAMFGRDVDHRIWTISFSTVLQQLSDYAVVMAVMIGKTMKKYEKTMDSTWKETHGTMVLSEQKWTGKPMVTVVMISWLLWESWETSLGSENRVHPEFMRLSCSYRKWHLIGYSYFQTHPSKNKAESVVKLTIPGIDFGQQYSSRNQVHPPTWTSDKKRCSNYLLRKVLYSRRHGQETTFNYSSTMY